MVSADSSRHAGRNGDDHQLRIGILEHAHHNGDQDTEGPPGGACGKGQQAAHQENNGRKEIQQASGMVIHQICHIYVRTQAVCHGL